MNRIKIAQCGDLLIRMITGLIFVIAGYKKLFGGIEGFSGMLTGIGWPMPTFFAYLVGVIELVGGILLMLGVLTWAVAALLAWIMFVAIVTVHIPQGWFQLLHPIQTIITVVKSWDGFRFQLLVMAVLLRYIGTPGFCNAMSCVIPGRKKKKRKKSD